MMKNFWKMLVLVVAFGVVGASLRGMRWSPWTSSSPEDPEMIIEKEPTPAEQIASDVSAGRMSDYSVVVQSIVDWHDSAETILKEKIARKLLKEESYNGYTPLGWAAYVGNVGAMKILTEGGLLVKYDVSNYYTQEAAAGKGPVALEGDSPLHLILKGKHADLGLEGSKYRDCMELLLKNLEDEQCLFARNRVPQTPLQLAVLYGDDELAGMLLDEGALSKAGDVTKTFGRYQLLYCTESLLKFEDANKASEIYDLLMEKGGEDIWKGAKEDEAWTKKFNNALYLWFQKLFDEKDYENAKKMFEKKGFDLLGSKGEGEEARSILEVISDNAGKQFSELGVQLNEELDDTRKPRWFFGSRRLTEEEKIRNRPMLLQGHSEELKTTVQQIIGVVQALQQEIVSRASEDSDYAKKMGEWRDVHKKLLLVDLAKKTGDLNKTFEELGTNFNNDFVTPVVDALDEMHVEVAEI